jgi:hypothetical protein
MIQEFSLQVEASRSSLFTLQDEEEVGFERETRKKRHYLVDKGGDLSARYT